MLENMEVSVEERVVSIGNGAHGVHLEVLVTSNLCRLLNRSPVGERGLGIIEPVVAEVLDVVVVEMGNALGDLAAWHSAVELEDLVTDGVGNLAGRLLVQELVVESVTPSEHLHVIQEMRIDSGEAHSAVVHLSGEDFVSEEVVAKDTAVGVSVVERVASGDVDQVSEESVHGVVLFLHVIQVLSVLVDSVGAEHVLKQQESIVVVVLDGGSVVENSHVGVVHLVVSDKQQSRNVNRLLRVDSGSAELGEGAEVVVDLLHKRLVVHIASSNHHQVVSVVVVSMEFSDVVSVEVLKVVSVTVLGLSEHVFTISVEVSVFNGGLHVPVVVLFVPLRKLFLGQLHLGLVEGAVRH